MPLTIVSVWALALPVRGRLETILTRFGCPSDDPRQPMSVVIANRATSKMGGR